MKVSRNETADTTTGEVDTVPAAEREPAPVVRKRGRPAGAKNRPREESASTNTTGRPTKTAALARSLEAQYHLLGSLAYLVAPTTGQALIMNAEPCAAALASWASTNPKIAKALERTLTGAGAVSVLAAHAPIALAVYADVTARTAASVIAEPAGPISSAMMGDFLASMTEQPATPN